MKLIKISKNNFDDCPNCYSSDSLLESSKKFDKKQEQSINDAIADGKKYIVFTKDIHGSISGNGFSFNDEKSKNEYIKSLMRNRDGHCSGVEVVRLF